MKMLEIVNAERKPIGRITCPQSEQLNLEVLDSQYEEKLKIFVENGKKHGFPYRTGRQVEQDGRTVIVNERVTISPGNEKFLEAMADNLSRYTFDGKRFFGLIKEQEKTL